MLKLRSFLNIQWKFIFVIAACLVLLPVAFADAEGERKFKCLYVLLLMGSLFISNAIPMGVTALLPVPFFPLLRIMSSAEVSGNYIRDAGVNAFAILALAISVEESGLHKRVALKVLLFIGTSDWRILLGLMTTAFLLSAVVAGTATVAALMIPIVEEISAAVQLTDQLQGIYLLGISYACGIGGLALLTGTVPNYLLIEVLERDGYPDAINFLNWGAFNIPTAILSIVIVFFYLNGVRICLTRRGQSGRKDSSIEFNNKKQQETLRNLLQTKYNELGRITFHELVVIAVFAVCIILWFMRDPQIFPGWKDEFLPINISDSTVSVLAIVAMFIIPKDQWSGEAVLSWPFLRRKMPWVLLLLSGGVASLAAGARATGLTEWFGDHLESLENLPHFLILLICVFIGSIVTEVLSNTAVVSLLIPLLIELARRIDGMHDLYLAFAAGIGCQYSFILPISSPANTIIFNSGKVSIRQMVLTGIPVNLICIAVLSLMTVTLGKVIYDFY